MFSCPRELPNSRSGEIQSKVRFDQKLEHDSFRLFKIVDVADGLSHDGLPNSKGFVSMFVWEALEDDRSRSSVMWIAPYNFPVILNLGW